ncbi:MAG: 3-phosphoserine/phosphohydroxythreonine transaminase [Flavobacteriales bacterium CG_4_9_14_3_um_filter_32_8]|nr:MAG: 3-phosphoserine/phosphohydroxythreonine transaminase [Flavobacteriales bacterium CG_4_9_14_3_um_filter_32_8]
MSKAHNFNPGPSILPEEVLKKASEAILNFNNLNLSILEISHRSKDFIAVMDKAQALVKELLNVPDGYSVLFLQGGASTGFLTVVMNYMKENGHGAYLNTGAWSKKAIKEAKNYGKVTIVASSEDKNFTYIPKGYNIPSDADYFHITTNNTIFGTQLKDLPKRGNVPLIADMSSDFLSRKVNVADYDLIYAGAQKNMGPAGTTVYIVKNELLGKTGRTIPSMLDLKIHIDKESMYNTPPVYAIYVSMLTLQWLKDNGGVAWIEKINQQKADLLYNEIDANPLFKGTTVKEDRSNMNATFVLTNDALKEDFDKMWAAANIVGIKGHRDVGGYRASLYNALPLSSVQVLVDVMKAFVKKHN